jgi:hypothetical protein
VGDVRARFVRFAFVSMALLVAFIVTASVAGAVSFGDCVTGGGYVRSGVQADGSWESTCHGGDFNGAIID